MNVWVENKRAKTTFYTLKNSEKPVQNAVEELKKSIRLLTGAEVPSKEIPQIDEAKNGVVFATFSALPKGLFAEEKEFLFARFLFFQDQCTQCRTQGQCVKS